MKTNLTLKQGLKLIRKKEKEETRPKLIKRLDKAIADYLKKKRNYICVYCQKKCIPNSKNTTISHYWSKKTHGSVRFEEDNLDIAHWYPCHKYYMESDKQGWYKDYKLKQLGEEKYNLLEVRARTITKFHRLDLQTLIDYYENKNL